MSLQNRDTLKGFFRKGRMPAENHFNDLIDSMINKVDDGMAKSSEEGLMLSPIGASKKLLSFYKSIEDKSPAWSMDIGEGDGNLNINNHLGDPIVSIKSEGKVGVNNNDPAYELDVEGTIGIKSRIGTRYQGKVPADGEWHPVLTGMNGCHALEIVAGVGKKKSGRYALIHGQALSTYGKSKNKINITQAYYGVRSNRIELKWTGTTYDFNLEMRTRSNYEGNFFVRYYISDLWLDHFMDEGVELE
ncbi:hypothetical protein JMN32_05850 [Fulvivirga sp. 29W222]|uniref:Adhesin n=1 Tax=Fulvivirga marina TaxID=2494733 RepID=A0A937KD98_9BACT|nr:hypothetical protein [Fulvivirga marina]MBL6445820.1 hypothetical protein [Fulvivirga marina]